jgi:membrane protein
MTILPTRLRLIYHVLRDTVKACMNGDFISQCAALSYYTFFAIAPLFVIALAITGYWFGDATAQKELFGQLNQLVGPAGGQAIQTLVIAAHQPKTGFWATCLAVGTLIIASTAVFVQLQNSLNRIWNVRSKAGHGWHYFIRHRLLSFAMVLGISFLLLVSLVVSAGLSALGNVMGNFVTGKELLLDIKVAWRNVWSGGFITALLFNVGKFMFSVYIGKSSFASIYGAVGSLVVILLWVYYSALILFFGAQLTSVYAHKFGAKPQPLRGVEFIPEPVHSLRDR